MGKGNVGVAGAYEGLFYIDNEDFHVYRRNDDLDDWLCPSRFRGQ